MLYVSQVTPSQGPWGLTRVGWPHSKRLLAPLSLRRPIYSLATPPPSPLSHRGAYQARSLSQCRRQTIVPRHVWAETGKKFEPTTSSSHSPSQKFNGTAERGLRMPSLARRAFSFGPKMRIDLQPCPVPFGLAKYRSLARPNANLQQVELIPEHEKRTIACSQPTARP